MAGTVVGAVAGMGAVAGVTALMAVGHMGMASSADADMLDADTLADAVLHVVAVDFTVEQFAVAEGSMVEVASTVAVDTVEAVDMVAVDTGKLVRGLI